VGDTDQHDTHALIPLKCHECAIKVTWLPPIGEARNSRHVGFIEAPDGAQRELIEKS
jgi:hypothetical protein